MCPRAEPKATVVAWADNGHWLVQITIVGVIGRPYGRPIGLAPKERPSVVWDGPERAAPTMRGGPRKRWKDSGSEPFTAPPARRDGGFSHDGIRPPWVTQ